MSELTPVSAPQSSVEKVLELLDQVDAIEASGSETHVYLSFASLALPHIKALIPDDPAVLDGFILRAIEWLPHLLSDVHAGVDGEAEAEVESP